MKWPCHCLFWKTWNNCKHPLNLFKSLLIFLSSYQSWKRISLKIVIPLGKSTSTYTSVSSLKSLGSALSLRNLISVHTSHSSEEGLHACPYTRFYWVQCESGKNNADGSACIYTWDLNVVKCRSRPRKHVCPCLLQCLDKLISHRAKKIVFTTSVIFFPPSWLHCF